jgi:WD40 repeat protein
MDSKTEPAPPATHPSLASSLLGRGWLRWGRSRSGIFWSRVISGLFLVLILALLAWGCFFQPPRNRPFEDPDPLTWFRGRDVHQGYKKMPMVPMGNFHQFAPRSLASESAPCCGLVVNDTFNTVRFTDTDGVTHGLARFYRDPQSEFGFAITPAGELFTSVANNRWQKVPLPDEGTRPSDKAAPGEPLTIKLLASRVASIAFAPDGSRLLVATADGTLTHWILGSSAEDWSAHPRSAAILDVAWSHDGSRLAVAYADGTAQILGASRDWRHVSGFFDALAASPTRTLQGMAGSVNAVAFSPDDQILVAGSEDKTVRLWETASGRALATLYLPSAIRQVAFSANGSRIGVLTADDGGLHEIDTATRREVSPSRLSLKGFTRRIAYSPDGKTLASVDAEGTTYLWSLDSGRITSQVSGNPATSHLAFSPDGAFLASASETGDVLVRQIPTLQAASVFAPTGSNRIPFTSLAYAPDGRMLVLGATDGTVRTWYPGVNSPAQVRAIGTTEDGTMWVAGAAGYLAQSVRGKGFTPPPQRLLTDDVVSMSPLEGSRMVLLSAGNRLSIAERSSSGDVSLLAIPASLPPHGKGQRFETVYVQGTQGWLASDRGMIVYAPDIRKPVWTTVYDNAAVSIDDLMVEPSEVGWAVGWHAGRQTVIAAKPAGSATWKELPILLPRWVILLGIPLLLAALAAVLRAWQRLPDIIDSIDDVAISDQPLSWNDPASISLKPLVRNISRFLRNTNTKPPLTIAVSGPWGSGKSSLMQLLMEDLRYYDGQAVWFNAWHHHDEDDLLAALFAAIRRDAPPPWWTWPGIVFRLRLLFAIRFARTIKTFAFIGFFAALVFWCFNHTGSVPELIQHLEPFIDLQNETVRVIASLFSLSVGSGLVGLGIFWLKGELSALPANPAKLAAGIARRASLADFSEKLAFRSQFGEQFGEVCRALWTPSNPGLVILIDDLDRCQPQDVLKILEAVNYLVSAGRCTVILGIDRRQVEYCVGYGFRDIVGGVPDDELPAGERGAGADYQKQRAFARRYLEKLINIEVEVPPLDAVALGTLFPAEPAHDTEILGDGPPWLRHLKHGIGEVLQISRVALLTVIIASLIAWNLKPPASGSPPTPAPPPADKTASAAPGAATPSATQTDGGAKNPGTPAADPVRVSLDATPPNETLPSAGWWDLWGPALVLGTAGLFVVSYLLHRKPIVKDSKEFRLALAAVMPLFKAVNATPRVIKRYQNRTRYIAAQLRRGLHEPDGLDELVHRLGRREGQKNKYLPDKWFETEATFAIRESSLILLSALEVLLAPGAFAERDALFECIAKGNPCGAVSSKLGKAWETVQATFHTPPLTLPTLEEIRRYPALRV